MTLEEFKQLKRKDKVLYNGQVYKVIKTVMSGGCYDIIMHHENESLYICSLSPFSEFEQLKKINL